MLDYTANNRFGLPKGALVFEFSEADDELGAVIETAGRYLDSTDVLVDLRRRLAGFSSEPIGSVKRWQTRGRPIRTLPSNGAHQAGREGHGRNLVAEISFVWQITNAHTANVKKKHSRSRYFILSGLASTKVWLRACDRTPPEPIAMWRFEAGDDSSPGCYFHVQVLGDAESSDNSLLFPKEIDVPRLPSIFLSLPDVIEFVLGELFQDDWKERALHPSPSMNRWRPLQARRLTRILEWKSALAKQSRASPWALVKNSRPPCDLLVEKTPSDLCWGD